MQEQPQGGSGNQTGAIVDTVARGLQGLAEGMAQSPNVPDEAKQLMATAFESFMSAMEIMGGGAPQQQGGQAPVENQQVV